MAGATEGLQIRQESVVFVDASATDREGALFVLHSAVVVELRCHRRFGRDFGLGRGIFEDVAVLAVIASRDRDVHAGVDRVAGKSAVGRAGRGASVVRGGAAVVVAVIHAVEDAVAVGVGRALTFGASTIGNRALFVVAVVQRVGNSVVIGVLHERLDVLVVDLVPGIDTGGNRDDENERQDHDDDDESSECSGHFKPFLSNEAANDSPSQSNERGRGSSGLGRPPSVERVSACPRTS